MPDSLLSPDVREVEERLPEEINMMYKTVRVFGHFDKVTFWVIFLENGTKLLRSDIWTLIQFLLSYQKEKSDLSYLLPFSRK